MLRAGGRSEDAGPSTSQPEQAAHTRLITNRRQTLALGAGLVALRARGAAAEEGAAQSLQHSRLTLQLP